jgi:hypothetical protein
MLHRSGMQLPAMLSHNAAVTCSWFHAGTIVHQREAQATVVDHMAPDTARGMQGSSTLWWSWHCTVRAPDCSGGQHLVAYLTVVVLCRAPGTPVAMATGMDPKLAAHRRQKIGMGPAARAAAATLSATAPAARAEGRVVCSPSSSEGRTSAQQALC